jgi:hypothetical protein
VLSDLVLLLHIVFITSIFLDCITIVFTFEPSIATLKRRIKGKRGSRKLNSSFCIIILGKSRASDL